MFMRIISTNLISRHQTVMSTAWSDNGKMSYRCETCEYWTGQQCSIKLDPHQPCPVDGEFVLWGYKRGSTWSFYTDEVLAQGNALGERVAAKGLFEALDLYNEGRVNVRPEEFLRRHVELSQRDWGNPTKRYKVLEFSFAEQKGMMKGMTYEDIYDNKHFVDEREFECGGELYRLVLYYAFSEQKYEDQPLPPPDSLVIVERRDESPELEWQRWITIFYEVLVPQDGVLEIEVRDGDAEIPIRLTELDSR